MASQIKYICILPVLSILEIFLSTTSTNSSVLKLKLIFFKQSNNASEIIFKWLSAISKIISSFDE